MNMKKILLVANKTWEVEPLLNALVNPEFKPASLPLPTVFNHPRKFNQGEQYIPRVVFDIDPLQIEVWCIQDCMNPACSGSSSEEKNRIMPYIFNYSLNELALVIAFGTAGMVTEISENGSVCLGPNMFVHDGHPNGENPDSKWYDKRFEQFVPSNKIPYGFFETFDKYFDDQKVSARFLSPRLNPDKTLDLLTGEDYLALSVVNVTNYSEYKVKDKEGVEAIDKAGIDNPIVSVETTHGVIRFQSEAPFIFISAITDREGHFDKEVTPNAQAQNYTSAYNGGIASAWLLPELPKWFA